MQLDVSCLVRDLQPQYAAFLAITAAARHVIPASGDHVLTVDVGGGLQAEQVVRDIVTHPSIANEGVAVERFGSVLEFVVRDEERLREVCALFECGQDDRPTVAESLVLEDIEFDYANQLNRSCKGALVVPGDNALFLRCSDPALSGKLANLAESINASVRLVNLDSRSGVVIVKGEVSDLVALRAALAERAE